MHKMMNSQNFCFLFLALAVLFVNPGESQHDCKKAKCGNHGPAIHFPFRLKGLQPEYCGYPGFELSCSHDNETVLELPAGPVPVNFSVKYVDYNNRFIQLHEPQSCLPRKILRLANSSSVFNSQLGEIYNFTFFNCPSFLCPIQVCDSQYSSTFWEFPACTKMLDVKFAAPGPFSFLGFDFFYPEEADNMFWMTSSKPNCGRCEGKGSKCIKKNGTDDEIVCYKTSARGGPSIKVICVTLGSFLLVFMLITIVRALRAYKLRKGYEERIEIFLEDYKALKPSRYSYADIKKITNQFKENLGEGAYGTVFKGKLSNEILVAVKILNDSKGNGEEFINELGTMGTIHHVNVVRLVGFCADGFYRALVYEFLPNESLEKFMCSPEMKSRFLGWEKLQDIALGIARGIEYLHQGCEQQILHFDIKPHNILLDQNFIPKISDFGLAKLCSKDQSALSMTTARGTVGYIAPEVFSRNFGKTSFKSDVYSFGILLLEMVGGRKNMDAIGKNSAQVYYPEWIYNLLQEGEDLRIHFEEEKDIEIVKKLAIVGLWCIQWHPIDRPSMKVVVQMLEEDDNGLSVPPNPFSSTAPKTKNGINAQRHVKLDLEVIPELE